MIRAWGLRGHHQPRLLGRHALGPCRYRRALQLRPKGAAETLPRAWRPSSRPPLRHPRVKMESKKRQESSWPPDWYSGPTEYLHARVFLPRCHPASRAPCHPGCDRRAAVYSSSAFMNPKAAFVRTSRSLDKNRRGRVNVPHQVRSCK